MARKSLIVKCEKRKKYHEKCLSQGKKIKYPTRRYNRCLLCGRNHSFMNDFDICRICFRELARNGEIMGVRKSSW